MQAQTKWEIDITRHYMGEAAKGGLGLALRLGRKTLVALAETAVPGHGRPRETALTKGQSRNIGGLAVQGNQGRQTSAETDEVFVDDNFLVPV